MTVIPGVNFVLACMTPFVVCGAWELLNRAMHHSSRSQVLAKPSK
ncbi:MAG TPA: hypothetical protein VF137_11535 [Candidatus Dormibacteraeota bacterium]